ncbi:MAG: RluA family pseudouridine synthase [Alistipes senegalensis]|nr:RluA family pseudouridine synthase [Alistipes senegalensis]
MKEEIAPILSGKVAPAVREEDVDILTEQEEAYRFLLTEADAGERLDKVVARLLPAFSRSRIQRWIEAGRVLADGAPVSAKRAAAGCEEILVMPLPSEEETAYRPEPMVLPVVYEDADMMVINKPAGLVVHPAAGNWSGTLLNGLLHYFPPIASVPRAGIVHRLDKDTSGLMAVAKTLAAQTSLVRQLQRRTVHRQYLALVWGRPSAGGTVEAAIARHPRDRLRMAVSESAHAKPAVTHYERLAVGCLGEREVSLLSCRLETGRTHQIRVHMQAEGFPLVGDPLYGPSRQAAVFGRQALHAEKLGLDHPASGLPCEWQVPLPDDFAGLLEAAGIGSEATNG